MVKATTTRPAGWQQLIARFPSARLLWDVEVPNGTLRAYSISGSVVIVHDYANNNSWTAYTDPFTTLDAEETFAALAKHCEQS